MGNGPKILVRKRKKFRLKSLYFLLDATRSPRFRQTAYRKNAGLLSKIQSVLYREGRISVEAGKKVLTFHKKYAKITFT